MDIIIAGALLMIAGSGSCSGKCPALPDKKENQKASPSKNTQNQ